MKLKNVKRVYKRVWKFFKIERFLCCLELESVSFASIFTAFPCSLLIYHDAAFLWNYVSERNEENERSGVRWLDVYEFWKWCEVAVYLIAIMSSFAVPVLIKHKSIYMLRTCIIAFMTLTTVMFFESILQKSAEFFALFVAYLYFTLCLYSIFRSFCREINSYRLEMLRL